MSKSKGNVIDPWQIFSSFGADSLRWYFFSAGQPWTPRRVFEDGIRESTRQTLLTLWNVFSFFVTYADLDGWQPPSTDAEPAPPPRPDPTTSSTAGCWASSTPPSPRSPTALEGFDALRGATRLARFVDDLSNWYVRRSRPRFWKASDPQAHATLHHALVVTSQLLAPFCPFLADELYVALTGETSVHLSDWPEPAGTADAELAAQMAAARRLVALGRAARTDAKVKVRQPLPRALVLHPGVTLGRRRGRRDRLRAQRQGARRRRHAVGPDVVDRRAQLPGARAPAGPPGQRGEGGAGRGRRLGPAGASSRPTGSSRWPASASPPTTSRCGPHATRPSPSPRKAGGRWRSTSSSTTTCGARAWPASSCAASTTSARTSAWRCPTAWR